MHSSHKVDVVMTTYNWPRALELALVGYERQSFRDFGMIIADDGSGSETRELIERFARRASFPIKHVWQENLGFRRAAILNKAIRESSADQVIMTDGDCIPERDFVLKHVRCFAPRTLVVGGYLRLSQEYCEKLSPDVVISGHYEAQMTKERLRELRWIHAKNMLYTFIGKRDKPKIMGLNFSVDRALLLEVNGYDENYVGWGKEDSDLRNRLRRAGCKVRCIWNRCFVFHIYHPPHPSKAENPNLRYYKRKNVEVRCKNGIFKEGDGIAGSIHG